MRNTYRYGGPAGCGAKTQGPTEISALIVDRHCESTLRAQAEDFIAARYRKKYQANIQSYLPNLMVVRDRPGSILAVAGYRAANQETLFVENYLDQPVERCIDGALCQRDDAPGRHQIVEIGSLASVCSSASLLLFQQLALHLVRCGYRWVTVTGCPALLRLLRRLRLRLSEIGAARQSRLPTSRDNWGTYYSNNPSVVAGQLSSSR